MLSASVTSSILEWWRNLLAEKLNDQCWIRSRLPKPLQRRWQNLRKAFHLYVRQGRRYRRTRRKRIIKIIIIWKKRRSAWKRKRRRKNVWGYHELIPKDSEKRLWVRFTSLNTILVWPQDFMKFRVLLQN